MNFEKQAQNLFSHGQDFLSEAQGKGGDFLFIPWEVTSIPRKCVVQTPTERVLITNPKIREVGLEVMEFFVRPNSMSAFRFANRVFNPVLAVRTASLGGSNYNYLGSTTAFEVMDLADGSKLATEPKLHQMKPQLDLQTLSQNIEGDNISDLVSKLIEAVQQTYTQVPSPDYLEELLHHLDSATLAKITMYDLTLDEQPRRSYPILP